MHAADMNETARTRLAGEMVVHVDGGATFVVPAPHRAVVAILAEDLAGAVDDGDLVRYGADLRALQRTLGAFGHLTERYLVPDIVLPPDGAGIVEARRVVRVTVPGGTAGLTWPPVLLFTPQVPGGPQR